MLTVNRLKLPAKLRRLLACTNSIENMIRTVRRVPGMMEAAKASAA